METPLQHYATEARRRLDAIRQHDDETISLHSHAMATGEYPPVGTFPARKVERERMSAGLEVVVEMLLGVL